MSALPVWYLDSGEMTSVDTLEILGVSFTSSTIADEHVELKREKTRKCYYGLKYIHQKNIAPNVMPLLWRTMGILVAGDDLWHGVSVPDLSGNIKPGIYAGPTC